jgi:cyclic-di-GMP phosphodiesterase TipF (flagellum assembly factor)
MLRFFRRRARPKLRDQVAALARTSAELARQVGEISHRLAAVEDKVNGALVDWREPPAQDVGELGVRLKQLAEAVARHDAALQDALTGPLPLGPPPQALPAKATADAALIAKAVAEDRVELYLQPIVTLPQRKVRCYEATARLPNEAGEVVAVDAADRGKLDSLMLFRCVQVARRLHVKSPDVGVICAISAATLADTDEFKQMLDFATANQALTGTLSLAFSQADYRRFRPAARENLAAFAARGFHFALDHVTDLRIEARDLADHGFRFLKAPAALLLGTSTPVAELLARAGIDLIAEGVENEGSVLDLIDHDVRFGQGLLFCAPRPARSEGAQAGREAAPAVLAAAAR